ncbi:hypothetical protein CIB95_00580 [Lottiidibacillus patelloidae]|uniref:Uncharacterized protein n=1 Tax=Lottiidibacillus patelloidae TaxID=2670334 RepID=A0A263BX09_9BACI|nr:hypothetical protein [Lottiidibacillus patelloidae]OZM58108.1 hypothetical protein CIB95_00580 [Lottiidibacillus patelloidae]
MTLFIYIIIAWLLAGIFVMLPKRSDNLAYLFLFMILSIVNINIYYIRYEKFHLATYPETYLEYISLIIERSLNVPLFVLFFIYSFESVSSKKEKIGFFLFWITLFGVYDWLGTMLNVKIYLHWNSLFSILLYIFYINLAFLLKSWFNKRNWGAEK